MERPEVNEIQINLRLEDRIALMDLHGSVTALAEKKVLSAYERATAQKVKLLVLNFSDVNYINSAGMAIIITLLHKTQAQGGALRAFGLTPHFQKIFEMVGLLKYIPHFKNESEARATQSMEETE
jgi:anti-anti-sigma factor